MCPIVFRGPTQVLSPRPDRPAPQRVNYASDAIKAKPRQTKFIDAMHSLAFKFKGRQVEDRPRTRTNSLRAPGKGKGTGEGTAIVSVSAPTMPTIDSPVNGRAMVLNK